MAKKKTESKIILERTYVIPLSRETRKAPYYRKSKKAMSLIKKFIIKHMKSETVSIGHYLNKKVWQHGIKNPPSKVKVAVSKEDSGKVFVELFGAPKSSEKKSRKESKKGGEGKEGSKEQKTQDAKIIDTKAEKIEDAVELKKEEKAETAKKIEKEEIKEMQHEHPKKHAPKAPQEQKSQEGHPPAPKHL